MMRGLFSLVGLLVVLAIVGLIAKHQITANASSANAHRASDAVPHIDTPQQAQQVQKQVQDDVNRLMQGRASDLEQQQAEPKP